MLAWHAAHSADWRQCWRALDAKWGADDRCPIGNGHGRMNDAAFNIDAKLHGGFVLMEAELIEPSLYFPYDERSPARFAEAVAQWVGSRAS